MTKITVSHQNYAARIRNYAFVTVVLLVIASGYNFLQYQKFSAMRESINKGQLIAGSLTTKKEVLTKQFPELRKKFDEKYADTFKSIKEVFPADENYTRLAIELDQFFKTLDRIDNPAFVNNLQFGQASHAIDMDYEILPVSVSFTGTKANFDKFLNLIENSGGVKSGSRLMEINSMTINFASEENAQSEKKLDSGKQIINATISLNAYFQSPVLAKN